MDKTEHMKKGLVELNAEQLTQSTCDVHIYK